MITEDHGRRIIGCRRCPRLRDHCHEVAQQKRRAYRDQKYWGRPVPSFGVADPKLLVVGLAPGAHGANRTGRLFTGDSSGDWLYRALFVAGFANQPESTSLEDGLELIDARVTCAGHCAPPDNRPTRQELDNCRPYLVEELALLNADQERRRVILALGKIAFDATRRAWVEAGGAPFDRVAFGHGAETRNDFGRTVLLSSYHPSRQNTQTGRLDRRMFHRCFRRARRLIDLEP